MSAAELEEKLASPGYTPAKRDIAPLFALLAEASDELAKKIERALARAGTSIADALVRRSESAGPKERARLVELAGRIHDGTADAPLERFLLGRLASGTPLERRRAMSALGKTEPGRHETPLLACFDFELALPEMRALVAALGNVGGEQSLTRLAATHTDDPELSRVLREARTKIERRLGRTEPAPLDGQRPLPHPVPVLLHVRRGLESLLVSELGSGVSSRVAGDGRVEVISAAPLERWFRARTLLHLGFPLPSEKVPPDAVDDAVVRALTSEAAWEIFSTLSGSRIRYRLEWASAGRRRGATFRVAERVASARPLLVNDPTNAPWEAVVSEREAGQGVRVSVELWPRGLPDPRFSYRKHTLPASSHPTLAAALALVAGARPDDVVWDPFVGSGIELCERAILGPYARLIGTDMDEAALALAHENLSAARAKRFDLGVADARTYTPPVPPTLIITNPPFGRRVLHRDDLPELFSGFLRNAARVLAPSGRIVWMSPAGERTAELALREGLTVRSRRDVDVGGIRAEMQELVPSDTRARRFSRNPR